MVDPNTIPLFRLSSSYKVAPEEAPTQIFHGVQERAVSGDEEEVVVEANTNLHMHLSILARSLKTVYCMCRQNIQSNKENYSSPILPSVIDFHLLLNLAIIKSSCQYPAGLIVFPGSFGLEKYLLEHRTI